MKKRIGSLLMALVLALSLVPATVWAADGATEVGTFEALQAAIASDADTIDIVVTNDIELTQELTISSSKKDITIRSQEGSTYKLLRSASFQASADDYKSEYAFRLKAGKLTFKNIILDGNKDAVTAKNTFVFVSGSNDTQLTLGQGATIQNCATTSYGAAVYVSTGKLVMEEGSAIKDCTTSYRGGAIAMIYEPWSSSSTGAITFTMKGATISGCSTTGSANYAQGGAIFTSGRVTMDIQDSTIENNTANGNGGAIYGETSKNSGDIVLNLSGTTITGNTSQQLGGGVYFAGTTFTVSGVTDITGNTGKGSSNNVYLAAGKTVSGSGLEAGSKVGISGANIPSTLVTGYADDSENGYFTADRTDTKLKATGGALELVGKEDHTHCICGRTDCQETGTGHRKITCKGVSSLDLIKDSGSYYLLNDVTLTKTWKPNGGTLCLNGHAIHAAWKTAAIELKDTYITFNLTDCGTDGKVTGNINSSGGVDEASGVIIGARATFNLYNGSICDNTLYSYQTNLKAGAVEVNGTFNMYGGSIKNNQGTGWVGAESNYIGGVLVNSTGAFNLYDGEISGNRSAHDNRSSGTFNGGAVYVNGGKFKMTGGVIKNNRAGGGNVLGDGGAVYIGAGGTFKMTGGEISGNTASRNGGGVAVVKGTFEMTGDAKISGNSAQMDYRHYEHKGGGVFVGASGTFTMSGKASVEGNLVRNGYSDSVAQGAGVYVSEGGTFTMSEKSSLKSNTMTSQYQSDAKNLYGGGVFVGGTMNLNGGTIEENTAYYEGGGLYVDTKGTVNLGTGTITVRNNTSEKTTGHNLYLPGEKKLIAPAGPADGSSITLSLPLARIQKAEGTAVITNTGKDIVAGDSRFAFEAEKIALVRDGDGDDVLARIPAHTHDGITYTPVYSLAEIPSNATGGYYLLQDSKMSGTVTVGANNTVNICLNGHKSEPIYFKNNGTLNITDCKHDTATPGYITGYSSNFGGNNIETTSGSTLNLTNVTVKEKTGSTFISATGATVNISGCEYYDSESGFLVASTGSKVTVTDSTFKNNTMRAPTLWFTAEGATTGSFTVKDCTFTGNANNTQNVNYETSRGCAINSGCPGTTLIEKCIITENLSHGDGGGIYLYGKGTATIKNTTVEDNESQWHGGGIAVDSANAPVFTGTVVVKNNKSRIPYNAYYQDMTTVVDCNVMIGSIGSRCTITTDSGFNASASKIGLSAWDIPSLVVSGNTSTKGFFVDDSSFVLRPTTSTSGPLLTSGNTGLELWHNGKGHTHCVCGTGENTADSTHTHEKLNWIGVTELKDLPEGNYYLLRFVEYVNTGSSLNNWTPTGNSNLCLNGKGIASSAEDNAFITVDKGNSVAVTDCSEDGTGKITGSGGYGSCTRAVYVTAGSSFTLWRGNLTGLYDTQSLSSYGTPPNGGAVWLKGGKFVMNGGTISKSRSTGGNGGAVYMYGATFIMNGGSISAEAPQGRGGAVCAYSGRFEMNGGTITGKVPETAKYYNSARGYSGYGGAVYAEYTTVNINGGTITGSSAAEGGGINATKATLTIGKANITDNTAAHGGGGIYAYECALTLDGTTVTGNNGGESLGGGIYISEAKGNGTASDPYIPAVIQNATIQNNTAKCGGGISTSGPVKISDTTITGNTATKLEKWGGGGVNARIIPKSSNGNGWVFELSGKMNITGNNAEGEVNNLYFPEVTAGTMLPAVTGLTAGSTIGVTTEIKPLKDDGTIAPVYITGDATSKGYFTSDEGYEVKLDADKNQLYIIAESSAVTVTLGENMTVTGDLKQTVLKNHPIADVTITAADGCYFPEDYAANLSKDGITVTRDSLTQITVSGTPTAEEVTLTLPAATAKTKPAAPGGLQGVAPSTWGAVDGKISGTKATMEWAKTPDSETWTPCTEGTTTVGGQGTYYVRVKATDISYTSDAAAVTVPKYLKAISFPAPVLTYTYNGNEHTLLVPGEGYTVSGDTKATNAGNYTATVNLDTDRYQWSSTVTDNTISWTVSKRAAQAEDFTFAAPENLVWDGHPKTANITLNAPLTLGGCETSLVYKQGDKVVENPTDPGTYQVYLVITGDGNFAPTDGLTADSWTFTIQHPTDHVWGNWQHDDTQHWRCCTVPGCTAEERENHTTDTPATCTTKAVCTVCESQYGEMDAHNHPAAKVTSTAATAPTCGSKGNEAYSYCADCHKYFKDGDKNLYDDATHFDIAALTHRSATKTAAVAATCEVGGNLAYWYCADCGNYYADKDGKLDSTTAYDSNAPFLLSALGHDYEGQPYHSDATDHWQVCKHDGCTQETAHQAHTGHEATCVAESKCQVCGYKLADKNPNNHLLAEKTEAKAPTCTQPGNDAYWHCADCGKYFADKNGDMDTSKAYDTNDRFLKSALDHDFTEKLVDDAHLKTGATCTEAAVYYYDCSRCDTHSTDKTFESGKPLGHDFTEKLVDDAHLKSAATCTESAVYYYDCSRCDTHSTADTYSYGDPLGHSYTKYVYNNDATYDADGTETAHCDHSCGETDTRTKVGSKLIDSVAPMVTGVENDKTYCKQVVVTITDVNSFTVTLNGQSVTLEDGKLTVTGLEEEQTLVATDRFGNSTTVTFTVNTEHISDEGKITKEPTAAVEGEKTFTCTVCGLVLRTEPVAKLAPTIVEGANGKHQTGGNTDLTFRSDASFEDFLSVSVDGKVLDKNQYTLREGSILVTLKADYLSTLSVGQHTLGVTSASGTAETVFTVTAAPAVVPTGDTAGLTLWVSLAALCGLGALVVVSRKKRENG
ncbi:hypothetical protein [Vescimonas sp.]|uniref:hypothetical protein n=1 Tax=Vescimonas sp. TaxID=2892404 RepID=UPI00307B9080